MRKSTETAALNSVYIDNIVSQKMRTDKDASLTISQKRMVLYLASLIERDDEELQENVIPISLYFKIMGLKDNGQAREELKKSVRDFRNKSFWLPSEDGNYDILCSWIDKAIINYKDNELILKLDDTLKPYLIGLKNQARTIFEFGYLTKFSHKYTINSFMYFSSFKNAKFSPVLRIEDAYKLLADGNYSNYYDFKRKCLLPAIDEINKKSNLSVGYTEILEGRKVDRLKFKITQKKGKELAKVEEWKMELLKKITKEENTDFTEQIDKHSEKELFELLQLPID